MSTVEQSAHPLISGERLSQDEFMRRWELLPQVKNAELIEGVVYVPSPLSLTHGSWDILAHCWLGVYASFTPGCDAGCNRTWLMLTDAPQPDADMRILPEYHGQSRVQGLYGGGAPELIAEISISNVPLDLGPKLKLYRAAGVLEYIVVLPERSKVIWHRLVAGNYSIVEPDAGSILQSSAFPGLWLDPNALLNRNGARLLEILDQGLKSPEHEEFVQALARNQLHESGDKTS